MPRRADSLNRRAIHPGFTLIELLIAVALITLITGMMYGSYAATTQSLSRYDVQSSCRKRTDLVLRLMTRQIRCAFAPLPESNSGKSAEDSRGLPAPEPVFRGNGEAPQGEFLTLLTTAGSSAGAASGPALVCTSYRYDPAAASLSVRQSPRTGRPAGNGADSWTPVLDHVTELKVEFHDGAQWQSTWDDRQRQLGNLPRAVRVALTVADERGGSYQAQTTIPVVCHTNVQTGTFRTEKTTHKP
jgi:prepilin-type N-terminal cleavage/methylation domain-containing protein